MEPYKLDVTGSIKLQIPMDVCARKDNGPGWLSYTGRVIRRKFVITKTMGHMHRFTANDTIRKRRKTA